MGNVKDFQQDDAAQETVEVLEEITPEEAKRMNSRKDEFIMLATFLGMFCAAWAIAGSFLWNFVTNAGGGMTLAWIVAIVGGFIAAALLFLLGSFLIQS